MLKNFDKFGKFYITTAIDYVNARPHIGHALEKIQADAVARYRRLKGEEVFFLTGTDEHGAKIARAAEAAGKEVGRFVDENAEHFRKLKEVLNLSWDDFIRTSDKKRHFAGAQKLWKKLEEAGDLYRKKYEGLYCVGHEAFVTEKDLVDGKCRDHKKAPEAIEEENWFFRLSKYGDAIRGRIEKDELRIIPEGRKNEILSFIREGLEDVSFSRPSKDISWGIPAPNDPDQTMYVWCDALANYITAIGFGTDEERFRKWWPADLHVIGKDILRFHVAIWPAMLLSAKLALPKSIFVHGHLTVEGEKMSKTVGNVIDPVELVQKYGTDPVRYFLLREIPSSEDGDFSYKRLEDRYNGDLANGLGNLVSRVAALGEKVTPLDASLVSKETIGEVASAFARYETHFEEIRLNEALAATWELVGFADRYINETKPWAAGDRADLSKTIANAAYIVGALANMISPFLPETAEKINAQIRFEDSKIFIKKGGSLFPRFG